MGAQQVMEVTTAEAQRLVAGGQEVRPGVYAVRSRGVTVTVRTGSRPGLVKVIVVKGCTC